jgi:hypothetical protein
VRKTKMQGYSHVVEPGQPSQAGDTVKVPMRRLDDIGELQPIPYISAVKIDVENYEYFVLQGGEILLRKHRPMIYCELWDDARRNACIQFLRNMDYRVMVYENNGLVDFIDQDRVNFFFLPATHAHKEQLP